MLTPCVEGFRYPLVAVPGRAPACSNQVQSNSALRHRLSTYLDSSSRSASQCRYSSTHANASLHIGATASSQAQHSAVEATKARHDSDTQIWRGQPPLVSGQARRKRPAESAPAGCRAIDPQQSNPGSWRDSHGNLPWRRLSTSHGEQSSGWRSGSVGSRQGRQTGIRQGHLHGDYCSMYINHALKLARRRRPVVST